MRCALLNSDNVVIACHELDDINDWPGYVPAETTGNPGDIYDAATGIFTTPPKVISKDEFNEPILVQLKELDAKSIRPLREGDTMRVTALESQAAALRLQLRK
jgi:hypothetical protein